MALSTMLRSHQVLTRPRSVTLLPLTSTLTCEFDLGTASECVLVLVLHRERVSHLIGARAELFKQVGEVGHATQPSNIAISRCSLELICDGTRELHTILDFHLDLLIGDFDW